MHAGDRDKYKNRSLGNMKNIVGHPCGQYARFLFNTSFGARLISEYLNLPLAVQSGRPPRIICLVKPEIPNKRTEPFTRTIQSSEQEWVDLGAGVPPAPPQSFV